MSNFDLDIFKKRKYKTTKPRCNAKRRRLNLYCRSFPVVRFNNGRCKLHGGYSQKIFDNSFVVHLDGLPNIDYIVNKNQLVVESFIKHYIDGRIVTRYRYVKDLNTKRIVLTVLEQQLLDGLAVKAIPKLFYRNKLSKKIFSPAKTK